MRQALLLYVQEDVTATSPYRALSIACFAWMYRRGWWPQVRQVVETLRCCSHQAFPVTPDVKKAFDSAEPFELHGTILRHTVLHLLQHRIGFFDPLQADIPPSRSHIPTTQMVNTSSLTSPCSRCSISCSCVRSPCDRPEHPCNSKAQSAA